MSTTPNMPNINLKTYRQGLVGDWRVYSVPLDDDINPDDIPNNDTLIIRDSTHLQLALYPDNPYWGEHLRAINEQAWLYQRSFTVPDNIPYRRIRLHFEGVDYFAMVWVNGQVVGHHEGHFNPFTVDITDAVRSEGENTLLVRVSSPWDEPNPKGTYPIDHVIRGQVKGLYEHGEGVIPPNVNPIGIWRPVRLVLDDGLSIDHVRIHCELDGTVSLRITNTNATQASWSGMLTLGITAVNHDGGGVSESIEVTLPPGTQDTDYRLQIPEPRLWWPWDHGDPNLYELKLSLRDVDGNVLSQSTEIFGVRTIHLERSPERFTYYVNERPVFVRGTSYMPGLYMSQVTRDMLVRDIGFARDAHLNLLRLHVHVSLPELYDLCDRAGMLIMQDFELNWVQDASPEFETRALAMQADMLKMLENHPSIITWVCHNEPTMIFSRRHNLEQHPDPALYAQALELDTTRPVFICSGQNEEDWRRGGDAHTYYGAIWTTDYTVVYKHTFLFQTEFGFEAPAHRDTLQQYPEVWERLEHLNGQIEDLWAYQAELVKFHIEHLRRLRSQGCAGFVHFWLADLVPQVGCGVLDSNRQPKGGYSALQESSRALLIALEHNGKDPIALWIFNDTMQEYKDVTVSWQLYGVEGHMLLEGQIPFQVAANTTQHVTHTQWKILPRDCARVELRLSDKEGHILTQNTYHHPFQPSPRPRGYPWKFDPYLGTKVFDRSGASSLIDQSDNPLFKKIPLTVREKLAEWGLRQKLPLWLVSSVAYIIDTLSS